MTEQRSTQQQRYLDIFNVIMAMRKETSYSKFEPNVGKIMRIIEWCDKEGFLYYDGECLMMGKTFTPWYNDDIHASDMLLYTKKESRGKGLAAKAIESFIDWANEIGANDVKLSQSTGITALEFKKLAEKFHFSKVGEVYHV